MLIIYCENNESLDISKLLKSLLKTIFVLGAKL